MVKVDNLHVISFLADGKKERKKSKKKKKITTYFSLLKNCFIFNFIKSNIYAYVDGGCIVYESNIPFPKRLEWKIVKESMSLICWYKIN